MVPAKTYRLGLLFVHGMGEQGRGDTVTEMGDALTEWLRRWISERGAGFRIREATLREESGASTGPSAHVSVVLTDEKGVAQEWLLAESYWAGAFRPATFRELVMWAVSVGPWLIASQGSGIHRRVWGAEVRPQDRWWVMPLRVLSTVFVIALAALVAAIVTPLAIVLLLVSAIPIPVVSGVARGLAQNLAGSFGDLLVLVRSPVRFAAMAERVRKDIELLDSECDRVMVVAHSQGSAVAWQGIRRAAQMPAPDRPRVSLFVSFGQAMRKLKSLYRLHQIGGSMQTRFSLLALLSSVLLVLVLITGVLAISDLLVAEGRLLTAMRDGDWYWSVLIGSFAGVIVVQLVLQAMATANDNAAELELLDEIREVRRGFGDFRWVDLWASADPASNGPLLASPEADIEAYVASYKVRNQASPALDHSIYWSNVTEFVSAIALMASRLAWPNAIGRRSFAELREAITVRDRRVDMLAVARVVYFVGAAFAIFGAQGSLVSWGRTIRGFVRDLPLTPDEWFAAWFEPVEGLLAAAVLALGALVVWLILRSLWAGPIRSDETDFFRGRPGKPFSVWATLWFVAAMALPVVAVAWVALNLVGEGALWFVVAAAVTAAVASLATITVLSAGGVRLYEAPES
jgi:hypothetical protein